MAIVKFPKTNLSISTRGIIGRPWGAGAMTAGRSWAGDTFSYSGIYQRRPRISGQILVKMKHYRSPNPQTEKQQAWRGYFADVKDVWDNLDEQVKTWWRASRYPYNMGGWNRFASKYMKRKSSDAGIMRAGLCRCGDFTYL